MIRTKIVLLVLIISSVLTALSGVVGGFPLRFLEPVFCIQMVGAMCPPFTILWFPLLIDFVFWLVISMAGFWGIKGFSPIKFGKQGSSSISDFLSAFCNWKYISVIIAVALVSGGGVYLLQSYISKGQLRSSEKIEKILREQISKYQDKLSDLEEENEKLQKSQEGGGASQSATDPYFSQDYKKRNFSTTDLIFEQKSYPKELWDMRDEELVSFRCSPQYTCGSKGCFYYPSEGGDPSRLSDSGMLEVVGNASEMAVEDIAVFRSCEVDDGRVLLEYEVHRGGGGSGNTVFFGLVNPNNSIEVVTKIPTDGSPYFGCLKSLQLSKTGQLFYECGGGDGPFARVSIYAIDLNLNEHRKVFQCDSSLPDYPDSVEPSVVCTSSF